MDRFIVLIVYCISVVESVKLLEVPKDTVGQVGSSVEFTCSVDFERKDDFLLRWKRNHKVIYENTLGNALYPGEDTNKYLIKHDGMNHRQLFTLVIKNLTFQDFGTYTCSTVSSNHSARLIVVEKPRLGVPNRDVMIHDSFELTCETLVSATSVKQLDSLNVLLYLDRRYVNGTVSWTANQTGFIHSGLARTNIKLGCKVANKIIVTCAIADHAFRNWTTRNRLTIEVKRPATIKQMYPVAKSYYVGDSVLCEVEGKPEPEVFWKDLNHPWRHFKGDILPITETLVGDNIWSCIASNSINNVDYKHSITFAFSASGLDRESILELDLLFMILFCMLLISIIASYLMIRTGN